MRQYLFAIGTILILNGLFYLIFRLGVPASYLIGVFYYGATAVLLSDSLNGLFFQLVAVAVPVIFQISITSIGFRRTENTGWRWVLTIVSAILYIGLNFGLLALMPDEMTQILVI